VVRAHIENPKTKAVARDACTAFELQVPVGQQRAMEELFTKVFKDSTANYLNFIYYKQHHAHLEVFYKAIQAQRLHEESYRVVAVDGIQDPDHIFEFEATLQQKFPEIERILPTSKSTAHNNHGLPIRRYNILCKKSEFSTLAKQLHQESTGLYLQYLQDENVKLPANHQAIRFTSRLPRSDDPAGTIPWILLDTKMACVIHTCHQSVIRHFDNSKLIMASSTRSYGSTYKPGGTLQLSRGSVTRRVVASGTNNMGRWCWTTYNGSAN
jgi:hypothetical protein